MTESSQREKADASPASALPSSVGARSSASRGPIASGWTRTWGLGAAAVFLLALLLGSGVVLLFALGPAATAVERLDFVETSSAVLFLPVHRTASQLLIIVVWLHLLRAVVRGTYRSPRKRNWMLGVVLLIVLVVAELLGSSLSGSGLFALHCLFLPAVLVLLVVLHVRWARRDDAIEANALRPRDGS